MRSWAERSFSSQYLQLFLTTVVALNITPFIGEIPVWIVVSSFSFVVWSSLYVFRWVRLPDRWMRALFAVACMGGVFFQYRSIVGQEPATALLVLLASLKLLETVRYRDAMYVTFVSYFLLMDYVLISQTLPATLFMIFSIAMITTLLFYLHGDRGKLSLSSLRTVLRTLWLAIPLWVFLFIVFPRFSAALFTISSPSKPTVGFSDELNPGEFSQIVDSDSLAFRATFVSGPQPTYEKMYWRGGVLSYSDGLKWTKKGAGNLPPSITVNKTQATVQEIVLEPGFNKFIFGLDHPTQIKAAGQSPFAIAGKGAFVFERQVPATLRTLYTVSSLIDAEEPSISERERAIYLQIPKTLSKRVIDLAHSIEQKTQSKDALKLSEATIDFLMQNKFRYTKSPGAMRDLDDFLFNKKVGFCEHYAATFATLLRVMGVPTRVVVGFEGGVKNRLADHWVIRSLDAHAWDEVYEDGKGWVRVDPTAYIAPLRLALGGDYYNLDLAAQSSSLTREQYELQIQSNALTRWLNNTSLAFDLVSSRWNNFLLKYNFEYQSDLLNSFGVRSGQRVWLIISLIIGTALLLLFTRFWMQRAQKSVEPIVASYREFCAELKAHGMARQPSEGPLDYGKRISDNWPSRRPEILQLLADYASFRYGQSQVTREAAKEWRRRAFAISRNLSKAK